MLEPGKLICHSALRHVSGSETVWCLRICLLVTGQFEIKPGSRNVVAYPKSGCTSIKGRDDNSYPFSSQSFTHTLYDKVLDPLINYHSSSLSSFKMRLSLLTLAGIIAFGGHLGVHARQSSNDLASVSRQTRDIAGNIVISDDERLKGRSPILPPGRVPPKHIDAPDGPPGSGGRPPVSPDRDGNANGGDKDGQPVRLGNKDKPDPKPKPIACVRNRKRSRIDRRAGPPWTHADLENTERLVEYIRWRGFDDRKVVFYATGPYPAPDGSETPPIPVNKNGKEMATKFAAANPGFVTYDMVFSNEKFNEDFKYKDWVLKPENRDKMFQVQGSDAISIFAKEAYAFNTDGGK